MPGRIRCKAVSDEDAHLMKEGLEKLQNFFVAAGFSPW
ncbi:DUF7706 family protein [Pseudomonas taetrolens]